ncbi:hypothetical protein GCM10009839_66750 [Catenulispora yoronensis]|uniref:Uncharacterized protein n=1 Tax=Catenulispora yoronensis TaxID=450799 RepID=A0ABP5GLX2_9ACTN
MNKTVKAPPATTDVMTGGGAVAATMRTRVAEAVKWLADDVVFNYPTAAEGPSEYLWADDAAVTRIAINAYSYRVPYAKSVSTRPWAEPPV